MESVGETVGAPPMQRIPASTPEPSLSFFSPIGYQTGDCGYCKAKDQSKRTPNSRASFYAISKSLSVDHYQILVDRGWRRSGNLLYKPDLRHSCCPHYTIRLPAKDLNPRKDQRQAINRWNRYVVGEDYQRELAKVKPKSKAEKSRARTEFDLLSAVHQSDQSRLPKPPPVPDHNFEVVLEADDLTEEKFELYKNYQIHVHNDPADKITRKSFERFLCSSPLRRKIGERGKKLGSYHQCYRLDGRLIALGVLDLLPNCVSGVYFIYHSDFDKFSFGKISALREAALALEGGYEYYYMGYYIHSCTKMRYKGDYRPQHLLDLETFAWDELTEDVLKLMDAHHYLSLSSIRSQESVPSAIATENGVPDAEEARETRQISTEPAENDTNAAQRKIFASALEAYEAIHNGLSLFHLDFPGMMTEQQLYENIDLDHILVRIRPDVTVEAEDFVRWDEWSIHDDSESNIKAAIAQLLACLGPEVSREVVVSFAG